MTAVSGRRSTADPVVTQRAEQDDLRALFGQSSAIFAALSGPTHILESANPAFLALVGEDRTRTGVALAELFPGLADRGILARLDHVYRTGESHTDRDLR